MSYQYILTELRGDGPRQTALIRLNRPQQLNALNDGLMDELGAALQAFDADPGIGCIILTGSEKAFAAGADIAEMAQRTFAEVARSDFLAAETARVERIRKPVIAAVSGYALGGGCELAMMCDFILASEAANFLDRDAGDPGGLEGVLDVVQFERLDDCCHEFHDVS